MFLCAVVCSWTCTNFQFYLQSVLMSSSVRRSVLLFRNTGCCLSVVSRNQLALRCRSVLAILLQTVKCLERKQSFLRVSAEGTIHPGTSARKSATDQHFLHFFYCVPGIAFLEIISHINRSGCRCCHSGVTVHMNPRLIVIAADADLSTGLISRLSSCDRSFLVDTCVHQFTISAVECCVSISEQDISTDHSATGCQIHGFYNILESDFWQNLRHVACIGCSA